MITTSSLNDNDLIATARELVRKSCVAEAELLVLLGEIAARRLYLDRAYPSMFAFCTGELGFSEDVACNRIAVARAGRKFPAIIEAIRDRRIHLAGLRLLVPYLTETNHRGLLAEAAGKSRRDIDEFLVRLALAPVGAALVGAAPVGGASIGAAPVVAAPMTAAVIPAPPRRSHRAVVPLSAETFKVQFTVKRDFRDRLREAQDLMRHRVPDGDLEKVLGAALEVLVVKLKKERFASGRKTRTKPSTVSPTVPPRTVPPPSVPPQREASSRHVPAGLKRAVYERDGGRCTFVDESGRRCAATGALEIDHIDGYARSPIHRLETLRLLCRAHNQHAAERMYGRGFMEAARAARRTAIRSGADTSVGERADTSEGEQRSETEAVHHNGCSSKTDTTSGHGSP